MGRNLAVVSIAAARASVCRRTRAKIEHVLARISRPVSVAATAEPSSCTFEPALSEIPPSAADRRVAAVAPEREAQPTGDQRVSCGRDGKRLAHLRARGLQLLARRSSGARAERAAPSSARSAPEGLGECGSTIRIVAGDVRRRAVEAARLQPRSLLLGKRRRCKTAAVKQPLDGREIDPAAAPQHASTIAAARRRPSKMRPRFLPQGVVDETCNRGAVRRSREAMARPHAIEHSAADDMRVRVREHLDRGRRFGRRRHSVRADRGEARARP